MACAQLKCALSWAMRITCALCLVCTSSSLVTARPILPETQQSAQKPLQPLQEPAVASPSAKLQGRFLHISDLHPDPFYKYHSSVAEDEACHRGHGPAGAYGAETTSCDSPFRLINATFDWIEANLKGHIDFIVWTGDSARHDNDESHPRNNDQIINLNRYCVSQFLRVFGAKNDRDPIHPLGIPIVPTWGNNDILPHNIFYPGPNRWTTEFLDIWRPFIPEVQKHGFHRGGWYSVEVIPNRLAVLSLNSLYFFDNNNAVDGCADSRQPGYEQFEWMRVQLAMLRKRNMKAILIGHVPPARTANKQNWDETCWQKYVLWVRQYRDIIVGSMWGHMNIDHFMFQDSREIDIATIDDALVHDTTRFERESFDDEMTIQSSSDYLTDLRDSWSRLPLAPKMILNDEMSDENIDDLMPLDAEGETLRKKKKKKKKKKRKGRKDKARQDYFKKIGGRWGERYSLSLVSPSIVPNYFPTLRIVSYNLSGLDVSDNRTPTENIIKAPHSEPVLTDSELYDLDATELNDVDEEAESYEMEASDSDMVDEMKKKKKKKHKKKKKKKRPKRKFKVPKGPSKTSPPGPAYSPQTLSWLGYQQLFANLTVYNNDFAITTTTDANANANANANADAAFLDDFEELETSETLRDLTEYAGGFTSSPDTIIAGRWKDGKHPNKEPKRNKKPRPKPLHFEIEYDTRNDSLYALPDLTVSSYLELATRIGRFKPDRAARQGFPTDEAEAEDVSNYELSMQNDRDEDEEKASEEDISNANDASNNGDDDDSHPSKKGKKRKHKKKKKKKQHGRRKIRNQTWYTFVARAFVGSLDAQELHDEFGQPLEEDGAT